MSRFLLLIIVPVYCLMNACQTGNIEGENAEKRELTPQTTRTFPAYGSVEKLDDRLDAIIAPNQRMERLASGYNWSEGPVWVNEDGGYLLFSDIPNNRIHKWSGGDTAPIYLAPSGFTGAVYEGKEGGSNRLLIDPQGNLVLCQHGDRRVARMTAPLSDPKPEFVDVIAKYQGKRLNSPNDAVFAKNGDLYFTDPPYGLPDQGNTPLKELDVNGVYKYSFADNSLTLLTDGHNRPNGITLTPDNDFLIVSNSDAKDSYWKKYPVKADGTIGEGRVLMDVTKLRDTEIGSPDGMDMHSSGHLFATAPGGVFVFHPDETLLGIIRTGQRNGNCTLNTDESHLYVTADSLLLRIPLLN